MTNTSNNPAAGRRRLAAIVPAAGRSTRMQTELPKVLHDLCGRPMLAYVLDACREAGIEELCVVVGFGGQQVIETVGDRPGVRFVEQREQKGSGHAIGVCADAFKGYEGDIVVIAGDMPMIRGETLRTLVGSHRAAGAAASLATTTLQDPSGYGRIIRDREGAFERIVEHRDCTPDQLAIREVNPSYYCFDAASLFAALPKLKPDNAKGEYYITDVLSILRGAGKPVRAATSVPPEDAVGINSRADLAEVSHLMQRRIQKKWMDAGVSIVDPRTTWIDSRAQIGAGTVLRPFTCIEGRARIGARCTIGPFAYIADGAEAADGAVVGPGALAAFEAKPAAERIAHRLSRTHAVRQPPAASGCGSGSEP